MITIKVVGLLSGLISVGSSPDLMTDAKIPLPQVVANTTLPARFFGHIAAMIADGDFVYAATDRYLLKVKSNNLEDYAAMNLRNSSVQILAKHVGNGIDVDQNGDLLSAEYPLRKIDVLQVDHKFLYAVAFDMDSTSHQFLVKVDKGTMLMELVKPIAPINSPAYALEVDDSFLYTGHSSSPGRVLRWNKTDLSQVGTTLHLETGENDIRSMEMDRNGEHIYANCYTRPGRTVKIKLSSTGELTRTGGVEYPPGMDYPLAGFDQDDSYLFTATFTPTTAFIIRVHKQTMRVDVGRDTLELIDTTDGSRLTHAAAIHADAESVFVGTYTSPARLARVSKQLLRANSIARMLTDSTAATSLSHTNMIEAVTLKFDKLAVFADTSAFLFAGTNTMPAHILRLNGFYNAQDCVVGAWSAWSACSKSCGGGLNTRSRPVLIDHAHGGVSCTQTMDVKSCNDGVQCPLQCNGTMVWTTAGKMLDRTCNNLYTWDVEMNGAPFVSRCQCPPSHPILHDGMCVTQEMCEEGATKPCDEHLRCQFNHKNDTHVARIMTQRLSDYNINLFHCQHTLGRMDGCRCVCNIRSSTDSTAGFNSSQNSQSFGQT